MTELLTNQLVEIKSEGAIFRVLWVDPLGRGYYVIDVRSLAAFPEFREALELRELMERDEAVLFPDDQWLAPLMDAGLPDSHKERRDRAWELIQSLALNVPDIFNPRTRGETVAALVCAGKATKQTVYRLLRRYWQRGMVPNALLPDYTRCGVLGQTKSISPDRRRGGAEGNTYSAIIDAGKGIRFWGGFYSCAKALEEHWFERARQKGTWKVRVSYDPRLMDDIYVQEEGERVRFIPCALTDSSADHRGKSLWEIDQLRKEDRRQVAASHPNQLSGQFSLNDAIQEVIDRADKKTQAARAFNTESDSQRTKGVRKNRAAEKAANRPDEAFRFAKPEQPSAKVLPFPGNRADDYSEPDITEILRSLGEDGDDDK